MITIVFLALTRQPITSISAITSIIINTSRAPMITIIYVGIMVIEPLSSVFVLGGCVVHRCLVIVVVVYICCELFMVGHVGLIVVPVLVS